MQMADLFRGDNRYKTAMAMSGIGSALRGQDASPMLQQIMMYDMMQRENAQEAEQKKQADALLSGIFGGQPAGQTMPARTGPPPRNPNTPQAVADDAMTAIGKGPAWLKYSNQNATRNMPLSPELVNALSFLPEMGVQMEVFSGGQPEKGSGEPRVGSTRHDHGNAADVFFSKNGRRLSWENPDDIPVLQEIVSRGKTAGLTGFGAGQGYMQPGSMHVGFGSGAVWGAGGKGANAPDWLKQAYNGQPVRTAQAGGITRDQVLAVMRNPQIDSGTKQFVLGEYQRQNAQPEDDRTSLRKNVEWLMSQGIPRDQALQMARGGVQVTNNMGDTGINYGDPGKGLVWQRDPQGKVVTDDRGAPIAIPYQGGDVWQKQQAQEEAAANVDARKKTTAGVVLDDVRRIREKVMSDTEIPIFGSTTTGVAGGLLSKVDSTEAGAVRNMLDTVRANIGFDKLQSMREESPTGGAVGQVSNLENRLMQATYGALIQSQGKEQFLYNLDRVEDIYNRIIHQGIPDQEAEKLLSGFGIGAADPLGIR